MNDLSGNLDVILNTLASPQTKILEK